MQQQKFQHHKIDDLPNYKALQVVSLHGLVLAVGQGRVRAVHNSFQTHTAPTFLYHIPGSPTHMICPMNIKILLILYLAVSLILEVDHK